MTDLKQWLKHPETKVLQEKLASQAAEIDRLRKIVSGYTDGISASAESNQPHEENDEKRGVADTDRVTLTDAERDAIEDAAGICEEHAEEYDGTTSSLIADILRNLLARLA